jgi:3-hydroxyacyl-[acyl-carrier-protein] dehydratase
MFNIYLTHSPKPIAQRLINYLCIMSIQSLYTFSNLVIRDNEIDADIGFDTTHEVFKGHFEGQPIVPGVCLIQIVKDLAGKIAQNDLQLEKGSNIKFLNIIDPLKHPEVSAKCTFSLDDDMSLTVTASIFFGELIFFKFKGTFAEK